MANIIIKGKTQMGKNRSESEENLRKEWGGSMNDENLDKLKYLERKVKERTGSSGNFISQADVDEVK